MVSAINHLVFPAVNIVKSTEKIIKSMRSPFCLKGKFNLQIHWYIEKAERFSQEYVSLASKKCQTKPY